MSNKCDKSSSDREKGESSYGKGKIRSHRHRCQGGAYAGFLTGKGGFPGMPAPECPPHCALGALCDIDPEKEKMCREKYPEIPFFTDWKEMVASGTVDAVITTVPHYLHHEIAIYCLEHGMNVLVEKPAGVRAKDVMAMNKCAGEHPDVAFGIMFNQRTNKLYQKIKEIVASGELGEIRRSNWIINTWWRPDSYYQQSEWRATWGGEGGGVLVNQAPHQLDLWQWICGIPTKVTSKNINGCHRSIDVENDVTMITEYANGATGCFITCTHASRMGQKKALLFGTYGAIATSVLMFFLLVFGNPSSFSFTNISFFTIAFCLLWILQKGFSGISGNIVIPMTADCADYETYRSGKYVPGLMGTLFSFVDKIISSLASTIVALMFAAVGYAKEVPTDKSPWSPGLFWVVVIAFTIIPIIGWLCNVVAMKFYPLTKEKMEEIQDAIAEIKAQNQAEAEAAAAAEAVESEMV